MSNDTPFNENKVTENKGYSFIMLQGYLKMFDEAAGQGLLAEAEDLVDIMLRSIPTAELKKIEIDRRESNEKQTAWKAIEEAEGLRPDDSLMDSVKHKHPLNRQRVLRKHQILTDVLYKLELLYKISPVGRQYTGDVGPPDTKNLFAEE